MTEPDMVTTNKTQLAAALASCEYGHVTVIEHRRKDGGVTRFTIGNDGSTDTIPRFERRLRGFVRNVKRSPAYVWQ